MVCGRERISHLVLVSWHREFVLHFLPVETFWLGLLFCTRLYDGASRLSYEVCRLLIELVIDRLIVVLVLIL
jgi:hypothetical protein